MIIAALVLGLSPQMKVVEGRLRKELAPISGVRFSEDETTLTVKYQTAIVLAPVRTKSAQVQTKTEPEELPTPTGFKLETYDFPHKASEPQRPEQAVRMNADWLRDYGTYKFDAVERQVEGTDRARYYYIEWGSKVDPKLILRIRRCIEKGTIPMRFAQR